MSSLVDTYGMNCVHILPPSFFILSWSSISFYSHSFVVRIWIFQSTRFLLPFHWMQDETETWVRELNCSTGWYNLRDNIKSEKKNLKILRFPFFPLLQRTYGFSFFPLFPDWQRMSMLIKEAMLLLLALVSWLAGLDMPLWINHIFTLWGYCFVTGILWDLVKLVGCHWLA